jgi:Fe-S-cluster containining protein
VRVVGGLQVVAFAPVGVQVQRDVVDAAADAGGVECLDQRVAADGGVIGQAQHVEVPRVHFARCGARRQDQRQVGQQFVVQRRELRALLLEALRALQLVDAHRGGDVGQVVLEARRHDLVVPARHLGGEAVEGVAVDAVQAHHLHPCRQGRVAGHGHAAFARGDGLVGVEAEHRHVAVQRADQPAAVRGRQRVGGVLDHLQAVAAGDGAHGVHVHGQAGVVHREDGLGARRDRGLDGGGVDVQRRRVDVHQPHVRAQVAHDLGGGGEGVRGRDDLVAGADAEGFERQVQPGRGRVDRDGLDARRAEEGGEVLLEAARLRAGGDPAGFQGVDDLGDFLVADLGQGEREEGQCGSGGSGGVGHGERSGAAAAGMLNQGRACTASGKIAPMSQDADDHNPCLTCGACCAAFRVSFYWAEAEERGLPGALTEPLQRWFACMAGTNQAQPRCVALQGEVGGAVACTAYAQRPTPCREVDAGDDKCQRARFLHGLAPLKTANSPDNQPLSWPPSA